MKKPIRFLLMLATGIIAFSGCQKETDDLIPASQNLAESSLNVPSQPLPGISWCNNFNTEASLLQSFYLVGSPSPVWVEDAFGHQGLFDNNGPSPTVGYAISKAPIGNGGPVIIEAEVYLSITNVNGYCVCPGLGITMKDYIPFAPVQEIPIGTYFRIMYAGAQATWVPAIYRGHAWIQAGYGNSSGKTTTTGEYGIDADKYTNAWHKIKIRVTQDHFVRFYIDDDLIWSPEDQISSQMLQGKHLVLGFTSSGNAGKAYHNYVKVTYPDYY